MDGIQGKIWKFTLLHLSCILSQNWWPFPKSLHTAVCNDNFLSSQDTQEIIQSGSNIVCLRTTLGFLGKHNLFVRVNSGNILQINTTHLFTINAYKMNKTITRNCKCKIPLSNVSLKFTRMWHCRLLENKLLHDCILKFLVECTK